MTMHLTHPLSPDASALPRPLESETLLLLRGFLTPILESADSWSGLKAALAAKGYAASFRQGRMVLCQEDGTAICTGHALGVPLRRLAGRIGRPRVTLDRSGSAAELKA